MRYLLLLASLFVYAHIDKPSTTTDIQHKNRLYFTIDSTGHGIIIPLQINDSITTGLLFDTGSGADLTLDSAFCAANNPVPNIHPKKRNISLPFFRLTEDISLLEYNTSLPVKIGETAVDYSTLNVYRIPLIEKCPFNGHFNIPNKDTTHVWELNFESNYI